MSDLMGATHYEIVDFKIGGEGAMGDLYRSWIIEIPDKSSEASPAWSSWREARPLLTRTELIDVIHDHHPKHFNRFKGKEMRIEQRIVPEGVLGIKGLVTLRIAVFEESHQYIFLLLESS